MTTDPYSYIQYAHASPKSKRSIILKEDVLDMIDVSVPCFTTWMEFSNELVDYFEDKGSVRSFNGNASFTYLPIDIDDSNLETAHNSAKEIVIDLVENYEIDARALSIHFSGSKGFHIEIPSSLLNIQPLPQRQICNRVKEFVNQLGYRAHIDMAMYKSNMLFRYENTLNDKTDLFKIPLTVSELHQFSIEDITNMAVMPRYIESIDPDEWKENEYLSKVWMEAEASSIPIFKPTYSKESTGVNSGERNQRCFELASSFRNQRADIDEAKARILEWNKLNQPPEPNIQSLMDTVESAYSYPIQNVINPIYQHIESWDYFKALNDWQKGMINRLLGLLNTYECEFEGRMIYPNQFVYGRKSTVKRLGLENPRKSEDRLKKFIEKLDSDRIIDREVIYKEGRAQFTIISFIAFDFTHAFTHDIYNED